MNIQVRLFRVRATPSCPSSLSGPRLACCRTSRPRRHTATPPHRRAVSASLLTTCVGRSQGLTPVEDPEYRYKMPRIIGKVEGRGNGIKTAIPNMAQLAQSLDRDPGEVTKFFGCELGAQTTWNAETERAIVNGAHTTQDLQQNVFKYIELFILCQQCGNPETEYKIKNEIISQKCAACGHKDVVKDMQHKLTTFILAQHKKAKSAKAKDEKKKDKKDKKKKDGDEGDGEKEKKKKKKDKDKDKDKDKKKKKKKKEKEADGDDEEVPPCPLPRPSPYPCPPSPRSSIPS